MPARQSTVLKSRTDNPKPTGRKRGKKSGLDALSAAEKEFPSKFKIRKSRLGEEEPGDSVRKRNIDETEDDDEDEEEDEGHRRNKRARKSQQDGSDGSEDGGSDSDGNEWRTGRVDSEDDSEIDSDEAMGESDEERFEGFTFRGSSTTRGGRKKQVAKDDKRSYKSSGANIDLSEGSDESDGEEGVDLASAWDMNGEDSGSERASPKPDESDTDNDDEGEDEEGSGESDDDSEASEDSDLSISDDDDEEKSRGLTKLQRFVSSLEQSDSLKNTTSKKQLSTTLPGSTPSEFGLTSARKLTVADLIPTVSNSSMKNSLKYIANDAPDTTSKGGIPGKLDAPLPEFQQERLDRSAAYKKAKETLGRWSDTVQASRRAEHLYFPLPEPSSLQPSKVEDSKPRTDLETTIQHILVESGLADANDGTAEEKIEEFEELEAKKLSIEDIEARRAELRKKRDLLFREEIRAKRIKKIKSKSYRRVHRKEREKMESMEKEALIAAGVDVEEENREKSDRLRAEARMSSKHRDSKWAKSLKQTGRAVWDESARTELTELARREEELQRRIEGKRVVGKDEEYLDSSSSSDEDDEEDGWSDKEELKAKRKLEELANGEDTDGVDEGGAYSNLLSMKFMKNAEASRKAANDLEVKQLTRELNGDAPMSESDIPQESGRQKFGGKVKTKRTKAVSLQAHSSEDEAINKVGASNPEDDDIDVIVDGDDTGNRKAGQLPNGKRPGLSRSTEPTEAADSNPWLSQTSTSKRKKKKGAVDAVAEVAVINNTTTTMISNGNRGAPQKDNSGHVDNGDNNQGSDSEEDDEGVPVLLRNDELIKRAFAGDEVLETFNKHKQEAIKDEGDKVVETSLPGWGSWTGSGLTKGEKRQAKRTFATIEGVNPKKRKDAKLERVIINEKKVKKNNKYLASQLPHPFETRFQYERSLRLPIGPEWTTKSTFQGATKPRVMVKQGVIKPVQRPLM